MTIDYEEYHRRGRTTRFADVRERVRVRTITDVLDSSQLSVNGTLLDVGAGEGRYLPVWRQHFPEATLIALELSRTASARSAAEYPFSEHIVASAEQIPLEDGSIDAIASVEAIEHVPSGIKMLQECHRVLKPSGWFLLSTPCGNRGSLVWLLAFLTGNVRAGNELGVQFGDFDDPTHLRRYRSRELEELAASIGFATERTWFNLHAAMYLAARVEAKVKGRVNIARRSPVAGRAFDRACDSVALLDWLVLRRLPFGSSIITILRKQ